jgi:hypothetical protein
VDVLFEDIFDVEDIDEEGKDSTIIFKKVTLSFSQCIHICG